jgi:hypothetical protein
MNARRPFPPRAGTDIDLRELHSGAPLRLVEYAYYASLLYGVLAVALGISVSLLGAAALGGMALFCIVRAGDRAPLLYAPIAFPVLCALSFLVIQWFVHGESLMDEEIRQFATWIPSLVIIHTLMLRRGFFHRFALALFVIGVATLPYMRFQAEGIGVERAGLWRRVGGELANPNGLAVWFGFCFCYFAIKGFEGVRIVPRVAYWAAASASLLITALTVSRGPIFACAIALVVASRRVLRRSFVPVLALIVVLWVGYELNLFGGLVSMYSERLSRETGRFLVWPYALDRVLGAPLTGVGMSHVAIHIPYLPKPITPHNSFLFIAVSAGLVPLLFYVAYWLRVFRGALRPAPVPDEAPFRLPLAVYAFLVAFQLNNPNFSAWLIASLALSLRPLTAAVRRVPYAAAWYVPRGAPTARGFDPPRTTHVPTR